MFEYFEKMKEQKKAMTKEEKDKIKQEKKELEEKYGWASIDGRREKVGNFRIEPPGLFRGRGDHPKTGTLKVIPIIFCLIIVLLCLETRFTGASYHQFEQRCHGAGTTGRSRMGRCRSW